MKKLKTFLEEWIRFDIYETEKEGIYQIYSGVSKEGKEPDFSDHGFNLYFGNSKTVTKNFHEYGFSSVDAFKRAAILALYYISRISAEEIVGQHIITAIRKGQPLNETNVRKSIVLANSAKLP